MSISFGNKFAQRSTFDSYEYITDWYRLLLDIDILRLKIKTLHCINETCVELRFSEYINYSIIYSNAIGVDINHLIRNESKSEELHFKFIPDFLRKKDIKNIR